MSFANFQEALRVAWEAAPPPNDGSGAVYALINTLGEANTSGLHRQFKYEPWKTRHVVESRHNGVSLVEWTFDAIAFVHRNHREDNAFAAASTNEANVLEHAFDNMSDFGLGVQSALIDRVVNQSVTPPNRPGRAGGITRSEVQRIVFPFRVLSEETGV